VGIGHGFCVNLCLGFGLDFGDGLLSLAVGDAVGGGCLAMGGGCFTALRLWICNGKDVCVVIVRHALYGLCRG
jgi:hypothetical protein